MARSMHPLRSILAILPALALAGSLFAQESIPGPGELPRCPDPNSVAIAWKSALTGETSLLRPESLLYGGIELWPVARAEARCDEGHAPARVAFSVNYTPIQPQPGSNVFAVDAGVTLQGNLIAVEITRGSGPPMTRRVWTLDASIRSSARRMVGERIEESDEIRSGPPDRVTLNLFARDEQDLYIPDLRQDELSVEVNSTPLPAGAIHQLIPPSPEIPLRMLIAIDISTFLEQGGSQVRFNDHYPEFVDDVVMAGLESFSRYLASLPPPVPAVEVGVVRYARSAQWLEDLFWRADGGLSESQRAKFHDFLAGVPNPSWLADGYADGDATLAAMRRLWHYFEGRRALIVLPRGMETLAGRRQGAFLPPPSKYEDVSIEAAAAQIRDGDSGPVERVLQHTERRYPTIYTVMHVRGKDWIRKLADATGGVTEWSDEDLPEKFDDILKLAFDDLRNAHALQVEIPNDAQQPRWKKLKVRVARDGVNLRASTLYESSGNICYYLPSYLTTEDPVTRLVAANEAAKCVDRADLQQLMQLRLVGKEHRETDPLVRAELFRSNIELLFRRLQSAQGKGDRGVVYDTLLAFIKRSDADAELKSDYAGIAKRLMTR